MSRRTGTRRRWAIRRSWPASQRGTAVSVPTWRERGRRVRGPAMFAACALLVIWGGLPWLPAAWGVRFGAPYLTFFSLAVAGAACFFMLLNWGPIRQPRSALPTFASIL